mmetsp:Transcript_6/g.13  ORF Transcript_6/g.13 Transcript_6/m.13 type:complete len:213 (-) Transcript_6:1469-2107(-)
MAISCLRTSSIGRQCRWQFGTGSTCPFGRRASLRMTPRPSTPAQRLSSTARGRAARVLGSYKSTRGSAVAPSGGRALPALCSRRQCRPTTQATTCSPTGVSRAITRSSKARSVTRPRRGRPLQGSGGCGRSTRWCTRLLRMPICWRASGTPSANRPTCASASARRSSRCPLRHPARRARTRGWLRPAASQLTSTRRRAAATGGSSARTTRAP